MSRFIFELNVSLTNEHEGYVTVIDRETGFTAQSEVLKGFSRDDLLSLAADFKEKFLTLIEQEEKASKHGNA